MKENSGIDKVAEMQKQLEKVNFLQNTQYQETIAKMNEAYASIGVSMARSIQSCTIGITSQVTANIAQALADISTSAFGQIKVQPTVSEALLEMSKAFSASIADMQPNVSEIISSLAMNANLQDTLQKIQSTINFSDYLVDNEGNLHFEDQIICAEDISSELENQSEELLKNPTSDKKLSIEELKRKYSVLIIFINMILTICNICGTSPLEMIQSVQRCYIEQSNGWQNTYGVIVDSAKVREHPNSRSNIIGTVYYGEIVEEIDSKPYWKKVVCACEDGGTITGWIASKNIDKYVDAYIEGEE